MALPYSSALQTSLVCVQGFSLMVATRNSTALKENDMTENILFLVLLGQKIQPRDTKEAYIYLYNFSVCFFSSSVIYQFHHLDGCQAMSKSSSSIDAF